MSGSTEPSQPAGERPNLFRRVLGHIPGFRRSGTSADENLFQDLNGLSIAYAACYEKTDLTAARKEADELLRTSSHLIDRLARWWLSEASPAFTAVSTDGVVYASEPSDWPVRLWPDGHEIWVEANGIAVLAKQFVDHGPRFFLGYRVVSIQAELLAFVDRLKHAPETQFEPEVRRLRGSLAQARRDFQTGAVTTARFRYLGGVALGLLLVSPVSLGLLLRQSENTTGETLVLNAVACAIAGAAGAQVSVLTRVTNESLRLDYHIGGRMLVVLGLARPVIGAVLALALYWATVGGVVPLAPPGGGGTAALPGTDDARFAFFIAIGFIAGFSERYAQDMLLIRAPQQPEPSATPPVAALSVEPPPAADERPAGA